MKAMIQKKSFGRQSPGYSLKHFPKITLFIMLLLSIIFALPEHPYCQLIDPNTLPSLEDILPDQDPAFLFDQNAVFLYGQRPHFSLINTLNFYPIKMPHPFHFILVVSQQLL